MSELLSWLVVVGSEARAPQGMGECPEGARAGHAVGLTHVGDRHGGHAAVFIFQRDHVAIHPRHQRAAADGFHRVGAAIILDHAHDRIRHRAVGDHMAGEDGLQLRLVLFHHHHLDNAVGQGREGFIGGCEDGERTFALQRLDQARGLHGGHKRGVDGRVAGVFDNVHVGHHLGPAHHRVVGGMGSGEGGAGAQDQGGGGGFQQVRSHEKSLLRGWERTRFGRFL